MSEEIISEIEEDLQKERFKKYWKNYGKYISLLIVFIILSIGGWQIYEFIEKRKNIIDWRSWVYWTQPCVKVA